MTKSKIKCAVLDDYQGASLRHGDWSSLADHVETVVLREHLQSDDVVGAIGDCEIAVIMRERTPFRAELLDRLPNLRLLITSGMRNASIDLEAAKRNNVVVCGTSSGSEPPAELTWALILGLARHIVPEASSVRNNGPWQSTLGEDLKGRTLGILGLGKIGTRVARVALAFEMNVIAWSPHLTPERAAAAGARYTERSALFSESDYLTIHLVQSSTTRGLVGADDLRKMRKTAFLINTSRAGIVETAALVEALRSNWIAGAGLDVFSTEPMDADDRFRSLPNVLATPHLGYVTRNNYNRYFGEAAENIRAYLSGTPIRALALS